MEIPKVKSLEQKVFSINNEEAFGKIALEVFNFQYHNNSVYQQYCKLIHRNPAQVNALHNIPFLPISFFKSHEVKAGDFEADAVFESSGTTGANTSRHYVKDLSVYEQSFLACFNEFYGHPEDYCILGLLPSYLERKNSSLVYMVNRLIQRSGHPLSGFYLHDLEKLSGTLQQLEKTEQKTILFGVTYALLDFAEKFPVQLNHSTIIETGGMKGRKKEITRAELNDMIKNSFGLSRVDSEYGMTELLSQAYAIDGNFRCPPWMRILLRDETDPFAPAPITGVINVIDLANINSCSFIATEDLGRRNADGSIEILGRLDSSDVRGCSLLAL